MSELRVTGRSEDGTHLLLTDSEDKEFTLRISDNLKATINQPRLASVPTENQPTISIKDLQARLRAGAAIDDLAREVGWSYEKVERFAGPILQERSYILNVANSVVIKNAGSRDAQTFLEVVTARLFANGVSADSLEWNTHRRDDGQWVIRLSYPNRDGQGEAVWFFDMNKRLILSEDEGASWIMGESVPAAPARTPEPEISHGLVYPNSNPTVQINTAPTPRLSVIRENEDVEDGVKKRASVPSWDEIMFGTKKNESED
ncbi:MAG: septation protein SepH [Candidatus Nanopelagicaceae bacterium]